MPELEKRHAMSTAKHELSAVYYGPVIESDV